jgi:hypothetical protein
VKRKGWLVTTSWGRQNSSNRGSRSRF